MNVCSECKRSEKHIILLETPFYTRFDGEYVGFDTETENKHICFPCFVSLHVVKEWETKEGLKHV